MNKKVKIDLMRKTTAVFGKQYYYVSVNGDNLISETWTSDYNEALNHLNRITELCRTNPVEKIEVMQSVEI
jgi:uncharacterized Zn finger protein